MQVAERFNLKTLWNYCLVLIPLSEMKILAVQVKISWKIEINFSRGVLVHLKTRVSLEDFANDCSYLKMISSYGMYNLMKADE